MTNVAEQLQKTLQGKGLNLTRPRLLVLGAMQYKEPQTMAQLVTICPSVNRASIYRIVTLFEKLGIIQRLQTGWKYKLELTNEFHVHHHHATCDNCGQTIILAEDSILEKRLSEISETKGFKMRSHQLELSGLCAACSV